MKETESVKSAHHDVGGCYASSGDRSFGAPCSIALTNGQCGCAYQTSVLARRSEYVEYCCGNGRTLTGDGDSEYMCIECILVNWDFAPVMIAMSVTVVVAQMTQTHLRGRHRPLTRRVSEASARPRRHLDHRSPYQHPSRTPGRLRHMVATSAAATRP